MREVLPGHRVAGHLREAQVVLRSVAEPARSYNLHKLTLICINVDSTMLQRRTKEAVSGELRPSNSPSASNIVLAEGQSGSRVDELKYAPT